MIQNGTVHPRASFLESPALGESLIDHPPSWACERLPPTIASGPRIGVQGAPWWVQGRARARPCGEPGRRQRKGAPVPSDNAPRPDPRQERDRRSGPLIETLDSPIPSGRIGEPRSGGWVGTTTSAFAVVGSSSRGRWRLAAKRAEGLRAVAANYRRRIPHGGPGRALACEWLPSTIAMGPRLGVQGAPCPGLRGAWRRYAGPRLLGRWARRSSRHRNPPR